jgi:hypothetical protein
VDSMDVRRFFRASETNCVSDSLASSADQSSFMNRVSGCEPEGTDVYCHEAGLRFWDGRWSDYKFAVSECDDERGERRTGQLAGDCTFGGNGFRVCLSFVAIVCGRLVHLCAADSRRMFRQEKAEGKIQSECLVLRQRSWSELDPTHGISKSEVTGSRRLAGRGMVCTGMTYHGYRPSLPRFRVKLTISIDV